MRKAISVALVASYVLGGAVYADEPPKNQLPSQEELISPETPRTPKVIINATPTKDDKVGATEIKDDNPSTTESVKDSPLSKKLTMPSSNSKFMVKGAKDRKTMAIALGGGGARGAAHIGVLRVLEQEHIPIDYIVGNSMGSIIGGLYSAGVPLEKLAKLGSKDGMRQHYFPGFTKCLLMLPIAKLTQPLRKNKLAGLVSGDKLQRYLETLIPEDRNDMEHLCIPFSAVATNLKDGKAYRISEGKLSTAIRASAGLGLIMRPVRIDDKIYTDGGIRANLPVSSAKDTGADVILAVLVDEPLRKLPEETFNKYRGIALRLVDIMVAVTDEHQLQFADIVINPDVSGIPILSNNPRDVERAIKAGEEAARKALPAIRQKMRLPEGSRIVESGTEPPL
jgi:NTE family protein